MNNQSNKPEKLEPQDSKQKNIQHPEDDNEAVLKKKDKSYSAENPDFKNPAKQKENSEQPVNSKSVPNKD